MHHKTSRALAIAAASTFALGAAISTATAAPIEGNVPTFQEFATSTFQDEDLTYIVNGDEPEGSMGGLRQFYDSMVAGRRHVDDESLIINRVNGKDDRWSAPQAANLTYCVSTKFGSDYTRVVQAMADGAGQWEAASSKVNYVHLSQYDSRCSTRNSSVVFSVEPTKTQQYIARAFFPSTSKSGRNILVNANSLYNSGSWTPSNIMAHELGHTLGFRHEHTRPEAGTCFEDNNWRALTPYDSASIMHYPQCNGSSNDLSMTQADRTGVQAVYGS